MIRPIATALLFAAISGGLASEGWTQNEREQLVSIGALARAAQELEKRTGAKTLEIRLADQTGDPAFEAAMVRKGEVIYMRLQTPADGAVAIEYAELPEWMDNWHLHAYVKSLERAKVPLISAIKKAEDRADAPAVGAGLAEPLKGTKAPFAYYIEVIRARKPEVLAMDAATGRFIPNPHTLYVRWTPVRLARRLADL